MAVGIVAGADITAAPELVTAQAFFEEVARKYADIEDYQANVVLAHRRLQPVEDDNDADTSGSAFREIELSRMEGALSFKRPDLLRIDFTVPAGQVLVSNGERLTIYIPSWDYIIDQRLDAAATPAQRSLPAGLTTIAGLRFFRSNYGIAYKAGPDPEPLNDDGSGPQVVKLVLERQVAEEAFEKIEVAVGDDKLIRSIVGVYRSGDRFAIEFGAVRIDRSIPGARFQYESPPDANVYYDVLFGEAD